jgi:hypothetical protein
MNSYVPIHPFWRAVVGAAFGFGIGLTGLIFGVGAAILMLLLVLIGGIVGVLLISGE